MINISEEIKNEMLEGKIPSNSKELFSFLDMCITSYIEEYTEGIPTTVAYLEILGVLETLKQTNLNRIEELENS